LTLVRQVSFTLLMTRLDRSNTAQYERNRSIGPLVRALGRETSGVQLRPWDND